MDIGRSFTYMTQDEDWVKKVLLGGVITLIPIVGQFFVLGYVLERGPDSGYAFRNHLVARS